MLFFLSIEDILGEEKRKSWADISMTRFILYNHVQPIGNKLSFTPKEHCSLTYLRTDSGIVICSQ